MNTNMESAKTTVRTLASQHYGNTTYFDEDKMIAALVRRGYARGTAMDAIISVQAEKGVPATPNVMNKTRLEYLRTEATAERLDLTEIAEIEDAFAKIPQSQLRDLRENATVTDMLDELEARV